LIALVALAGCDPDYEPPGHDCGPHMRSPVFAFDGIHLLQQDVYWTPEIGHPEGLTIPATDGRGFLLLTQRDDATLAAPIAPGTACPGPAQVVLDRPSVFRYPLQQSATELGGGSFDGRNYVVAWAEYDVHRQGYDPTLKMARLSTDGHILDPGGIVLHAGFGERPLYDVDTQLPVVASDGRDSLVVWCHRNSIWPRRDNYAIRAARFRADGTLVDPEGFAVVDTVSPYAPLSLLWDGSAYILVHEAQSPDGSGSQAQYFFRGVRLSRSGEVLGPLFSMPIEYEVASQRRASAAVNGDTLLIAWNARREIRVLLVRHVAGEPRLDTYVVGETSGGGLTPPTVTAIAGGFAVAWAENWKPEPTCFPTTKTSYVRRIGTDGTFAPSVMLWPRTKADTTFDVGEREGCPYQPFGWL
jgi:hypothetical protein